MSKHFLPLALLAAAFVGSPAQAQTKKTSSKSSGKGSGGAGYTTGIGLRGGNFASGLTVKHFFNPGANAAVEGLVTTEYLGKGVRFTLLFEKHWQIVPDIKNLQWYVGGGLHAGAYRGRYYYAVAYRYKHNKDYVVYYYPAYEDKVYPVFGADLVLGMEYKVPDLPLTLGIDYKPYFDVFDGNTGLYHDAALSVRFTF